METLLTYNKIWQNSSLDKYDQGELLSLSYNQQIKLDKEKVKPIKTRSE